MDQEKEAEVLDRIRKLETRLSILEEKFWRLSQTGTADDFSAVPSEPDSDEPIIDG
jgi:hypothetical protein